jgi:hypothetical protein
MGYKEWDIEESALRVAVANANTYREVGTHLGLGNLAGVNIELSKSELNYTA